MERVLENNKHCQEKYEQKLHEIELQCPQKDIDVGNSNLKTIKEDTKDENDLEEIHFVQVLEDKIHEHEISKHDKNYELEETICMTKIRDLYETANKNTKPIVQTEENCNVGELEGHVEKETMMENDELTTETIYNLDLKKFNGNSNQCSRTFPRWNSYKNDIEDKCIVSKTSILLNEDDLTMKCLSAEKALNTNLQLFNRCENSQVVLDEFPIKSQHEEVLDPNIKLGMKNNDEITMTRKRNYINGLYVLTNELFEENDNKNIETIVNPLQYKDLQNGTSDITDEGAVKKKKSGEVGVEVLQLPKPYKDRPSNGCRLMVQVCFKLL